jgi:hypothetical protein
MNKVSWIVVAAACAVAVSLRLIDRPEMNFSALGALAVLCGAVVRPAWVGVLIPLGCRVLTDGIIEAKTSHGFYGSWMFDYAAYVAIFALGRWLQPKSISMAFGTGLLAGAAFFTISNLGVWCMPHEAGEYLYPRTLAGLTNCFLNAIPFARGTFTGDIGFTVVFTGAMQLLALSVKQESPAVNQTATADR